MVKYEVVVVLDAVQSEEEHNALLEKIEGVITSNGGAVENRDVWGKRRLAYPINKKRDGYYAVYILDVDPASQVLSELDRFMRINEQVLRFLITKAVLGKSTGDPAKYEVFERGLQQQRAQRMAEAAERRERRMGSGSRDDRGGPRDDRGGPREDRRPAPSGSAAPAASNPAPAESNPAPASAPSSDS